MVRSKPAPASLAGEKRLHPLRGIKPRALFITFFVLTAGCASTAGWGPPPTATSAEAAAAKGGAPAFRSTTAIGGTLAKRSQGVKVPPNVRVQDCAIVAISSPARFACDGKVYTSFELESAQKAQGNN
jgi:hypothetical protein